MTDGHTITILDADKVQHKIRLEGIDAPESKQAFGTKAKQALSDRVFGKSVRVEWKEKDCYGRTLGHVYAGSDHVNLSMIRDGYAWHCKRYNKDQKLADAEVEAREAGRGLWADREAANRRGAGSSPRTVQSPTLARRQRSWRPRTSTVAFPSDTSV